MTTPEQDALFASIAVLRQGTDPEDTCAAAQQMFENWASCDEWQLDTQALPLIIGVAPEQWPTHLDHVRAATEVTAVTARIAADLETTTSAAVTPLAVRQWARNSGVALPQALARLLDYVAQVVPSGLPDADAEAAAGQAADRERVLGVALALVTRFPLQCRDDNGFYDGGVIADLMLAQAARWFPLAPPALARDDIAALLESWLH